MHQSSTWICSVFIWLALRFVLCHLSGWTERAQRSGALQLSGRSAWRCGSFPYRATGSPRQDQEQKGTPRFTALALSHPSTISLSRWLFFTSPFSALGPFPPLCLCFVLCGGCLFFLFLLIYIYTHILFCWIIKEMNKINKKLQRCTKFIFMLKSVWKSLGEGICVCYKRLYSIHKALFKKIWRMMSHCSWLLFCKREGREDTPQTLHDIYSGL